MGAYSKKKTQSIKFSWATLVNKSPWEDADQQYAHGATPVTKNFMCDSSQHKSRGAALVNKTLMGQVMSAKFSWGVSSKQNSQRATSVNKNLMG